MDVRDSLSVWCVGVVQQVITLQGRGVDILLVHFEGWSKTYDEMIPANSRRLAPLGQYTQLSDIPKYMLHRTILGGDTIQYSYRYLTN